MPQGKISRQVHDDQEERSAVEGAKLEEGKACRHSKPTAGPLACPWRLEILAGDKATQESYLCLLQKNRTGPQRGKSWKFGHKRRQWLQKVLE